MAISEPEEPKVQHYQTDSTMVVTILKRHVDPAHVAARFQETSVSVSGPGWAWIRQPEHAIVPDKCRVVVGKANITVTLAKAEPGLRWTQVARHSLDAAGDPAAPPTRSPPACSQPAYLPPTNGIPRSETALPRVPTAAASAPATTASTEPRGSSAASLANQPAAPLEFLSHNW